MSSNGRLAAFDEKRLRVFRQRKLGIFKINFGSVLWGDCITFKETGLAISCVQDHTQSEL